MKKLLPLFILTFLSDIAFAQVAPYTELFCPVDTAWEGKTLVVPQSSLKYNILLREGDVAHNLEKNNNAPLKGGFGSVYYDGVIRETFPVGNIASLTKETEGWLYLSLQDNKTGNTGDGGGLVKIRVKQNNTNEWETVPQTESGTTFTNRYFDMDNLGGSVGNNGLHLGFKNLSDEASKGNIFMFDAFSESNAAIASGLTDMSNFTLPAGSPQPGLSIPKFQNMGWIMEINRATGKPLRKIYQAGRGDFGGLLASSNKLPGGNPLSSIQRIIFTTQTQPSVILMYTIEGALQEQKLYAFKQAANKYTGEFILLNDQDVDGSVFPFSFEELLDVQKIALSKGATMFNRLGSICKDGTDNYFIAETGGNSEGTAFSDPNRIYSGTFARHLQQKDQDQDGKFSDPYGRILRWTFDPVNGIEIKPYLEGGISMDGRYTFSNPKQIGILDFDYGVAGSAPGLANYLVINEQVPDAAFRRNPESAQTPEALMNETYFLNLKTPNPDISHLRPFAIGPRGAEVQSVFSIQSLSPLFISLRYPNTNNSDPYHKSLLISVNNFEEYFDNPEGCGWVAPPPGTGVDTSTTSIPQIIGQNPDNSFDVWPNPATRTLFFAEAQKEIRLYDATGRMLRHEKDTKSLDIFDLSPGMYFISNDKGQNKKVVIE